MAEFKQVKSQSQKLGAKAARGHSSDIFFYSGEISEEGYAEFFGEVAKYKRAEKVILILVTSGGSGAAAFKISRLLQNLYVDFEIFAPAFCKSAGTIIALGANHIWMGPVSELGPIDAQVPQQDEIGTIESSLYTRASLDALMGASFDFFEAAANRLVQRSQGSISFKLAAEISSSMAAGMVSTLVAKIDPTLLGRHRRQAEEGIKYGLELVALSENADDSTVYKLARDYPCHDFVIDLPQAERLFTSVSEPTRLLQDLANELVGLFQLSFQGGVSIGTFHEVGPAQPGQSGNPSRRSKRSGSQANDDQTPVEATAEELKAA